MNIRTRPPLVVIADDDPGALLLHGTALTGGGFDVITASDGAAALEEYRNVQPDCLVLDVIMPELNGYELCKAIRKLPEGRHVPILILTSLDDREAIGVAYAAGATDFAQKGIAPLLLVERVRFLVRAYELQRDLLDSEARLAEAQRITRTGHWEMNLEGKTVSVSPMALELLELGASAADDCGALYDRLSASDQERLEQAIRGAIGADERFRFDVRSLVPSGGERLLQLQGQLSARSLGGLERTLVITLQDLTELRRAEERVRVLAHFDAATGLPNLTYLRERLTQSLADMGEAQIAVVQIDIEHFNRVNDSLGAAAGDELLMHIGQRLGKTLAELQSQQGRSSDAAASVTARIGGDEFCVALSLRRHENELSEALASMHAALTSPFNIQGNEVTIGATMGVAAAPEDACDADTLLRFANAALHQAKQTARGSYHYYSAKLQTRAAHRLSIESDLRHAIQREELQLLFQPRLALDTMAPTGAEALLRWNHPQRGMVSPAEFIPIAEDLGLIVEFGAWVLHEATRRAAEWARAGTPLAVAVNVSAVQFQRASVPQQVASALHAASLDPRLLELEITEGILIEQPQLVSEALQAVKADGIRIALDDFGTGYSSLSYLRRLPLDYLKIDRSFVNDIEDGSGLKLVDAILGIARSLGLRTVAEGIETPAQLQALSNARCDEAQGFLIARPMPAHEVLPWVARQLKQGAVQATATQPKQARQL